MKKLWNKNSILNKDVEAFETKDDLLLDQKLLSYDIEGSLAHAKMLFKIGILEKNELIKLQKGLLEIKKNNDKGKFNLQFSDEDIHTKIENYLTQKYGDVGKKIHTLRSRNDQVLTALRLFTKSELEKIKQQTIQLIKSFEDFDKKWGKIPMPGYTHMQKAMPSSVNLWTNSYISSLKDDLNILEFSYQLINQSPLGSAAGYGTPIKLDKKYTAKLLNFAKVQENPLYCQNSRGKFESFVLSALIQVLLTINKFSSDVLLFTTSEFAFFEVSDQITTGSSIMPQKKNVDLAELLRSKVHIVLGNFVSITSLSSNLISGYNRDIQDSKKQLMESLEITFSSLKVTKTLLESLKPNQKVLEKSMTDELFATKKALDLVLKGENFRDAYLKVKGGENNEK